MLDIPLCWTWFTRKMITISWALHSFKVTDLENFLLFNIDFRSWFSKPFPHKESVQRSLIRYRGFGELEEGHHHTEHSQSLQSPHCWWISQCRRRVWQRNQPEPRKSRGHQQRTNSTIKTSDKSPVQVRGPIQVEAGDDTDGAQWRVHAPL